MDCSHMSGVQAAHLANKKKIHVLVDLVGYTGVYVCVYIRYISYIYMYYICKIYIIYIYAYILYMYTHTRTHTHTHTRVLTHTHTPV